MGKRYYSEASMVCHQSAKDLFEIGAISEAEMKGFDNMCFVEEEPEIDYADEKSTVSKHVTTTSS
jgi:DNA-binding transcriptional regulator YiaG